jgi:hypothetical protein
MHWSLKKQNNRYALVGDRTRSLLAAKNQGPTGVIAATPLGWADCSLSETRSVHQVMTNLPTTKGTVAISLPLDYFEVLTLTVNKVPREVVAKILPYHIGKVLDEPLTEFIYDWQIVKELKDSLQINVFLFPAKMFQELRATLSHYKIMPTSLEPDVYSACAYLEAGHQLQADEATLIALLWPKSLSLAIYDKENLVLTRAIQLKQPRLTAADQDEPAAEQAMAPDQAFQATPGATPTDDDSLFEPSPDDLLANFLVATRKEPNQADAAHDSADTGLATASFERPSATDGAGSMVAYINQVALELMRTRDYFNSVVKGNQIKTVFVGGGDEAWHPLAAELKNSLGLTIKQLMDPELATFGDPLLEAVSIGVLS